MPTIRSAASPSRIRKALVLTGAFVLFGAAAFGVVAALFPELRVGFISASLVLVIVAGALLVFGRKAGAKGLEMRRLMESGIAAKATIVSMTQTGVVVNFNPQVKMTLSVETIAHSAYEVTLKEIVPLLVIGRLSSGEPLAVKVDPDDPRHIAIDWEASTSRG